MSTVARVMKYEVRDVIRSRWVLAYTAFFLVVTDGLLRFTGDSANAILSLLNVVLIIIPLVNVVFGTMYLYDAREFVELLLASPCAGGTCSEACTSGSRCRCRLDSSPASASRSCCTGWTSRRSAARSRCCSRRGGC